ncbi:MAG: hypothetical protein A2X99_02340 [Deltaproteobacteria bacterium GWB2_55_19]|nr:MAG: hypothetical protein A2X99_02340 [Deltaproteobacteria bacterium GWB2_55_19]
METYHFDGLYGFPSKCGLDIYIRDDRAVVMFTEMPDDPGTSITNFIEELATQIYNERLKGCPVENIRFVECYPKDPYREVATYDLVHLEWTGREFKNPTWERIDPDKKQTRPYGRGKLEEFFLPRFTKPSNTGRKERAFPLSAKADGLHARIFMKQTEKITIACFGECGRSVTLRRSKVRKADYYLCNSNA